MADGKVKVTPELIARVRSGERRAVKELLAIVGPLLLFHMKKIFLRQGFDAYTSTQYAKDASQEVLRVYFFEDDGRRTRNWVPERGPFEYYFVLFARDHIQGKLRKKTESPLPEAWESAEVMVDRRSTPHEIVSSRELWNKVFRRTWEGLEEKGRKMLELLFLEHREVEEVCSLMQMTEDAVYQWRSRLVRRMEAIAIELGGEE